MKTHFSKALMMAGIVFCSLVSLSSFAQEGKHDPQEMAKKLTEKMKTGLNLTDDQYSKVYDLNVKNITSMQDLRKEPGSKENKKQSFKNLRDEHQKELATVLTPEQMTKYMEMKKEMKKEMKNKRGQHTDKT